MMLKLPSLNSQNVDDPDMCITVPFHLSKGFGSNRKLVPG